MADLNNGSIKFLLLLVGAEKPLFEYNSFQSPFNLFHKEGNSKSSMSFSKPAMQRLIDLKRIDDEGEGWKGKGTKTKKWFKVFF